MLSFSGSILKDNKLILEISTDLMSSLVQISTIMSFLSLPKMQINNIYIGVHIHLCKTKGESHYSSFLKLEFV